MTVGCWPWAYWATYSVLLSDRVSSENRMGLLQQGSHCSSSVISR